MIEYAALVTGAFITLFGVMVMWMTTNMDILGIAFMAMCIYLIANIINCIFISSDISLL